jgi:osmotically-inducible protein OsmY
MNDTTGLKEKLELNLLQDSRFANYPIDVTDNNGIITLAGEVSSEELSQAAEAVARQTEGVITVINEIVVVRDAVRTAKQAGPNSPIIPPR